MQHNDYHSQRFKRILSPSRSSSSTAYQDAMQQQNTDLHKDPEQDLSQKRRKRWDVTREEKEGNASTLSEWDRNSCKEPPSSTRSRWDQTPEMVSLQTPSRRSRWDQTPLHSEELLGSATPIGIPLGAETPLLTKEAFDAIEARHQSFTPSTHSKPLSDAELDAVLPDQGFEIVAPPEDYTPIRTPARKLSATPARESEFFIQSPSAASSSFYGFGSAAAIPDDLPFAKAEDFQYFAKLLDGKADDEMSIEEAKERKILQLLLRIKNGIPSLKRHAMKQLTERAKELGPEALFNALLPLLMSPTLEQQERHTFVKVIDRVIYRLAEQVQPFVHKILVVVQPMLIDEEYYARMEAKEIIANLSKAAGLPSMISAMRPDIDHADEYVRNTTSRALAVVAGALGIAALLPFLKAVCASKKSWKAKHTGVKVIQQIAILMGVGILPFLKPLIGCLEGNLEEEQQSSCTFDQQARNKIRTMTALAIAALAEASAPWGIESFESMLKPLWRGLRQHRGKTLAAYIRAVGFVVPLMDTEYAAFYSKEVLAVLTREFTTPDDAMKRIILLVLKQVALTEGISIMQLQEQVLPEFFQCFWIRRMALEERNYKELVQCTTELAEKAGAHAILLPLIDRLKDESESLRKMVCQTVKNVISKHGTDQLNDKEVERLLDSLSFAFAECASCQESISSHIVIEAYGEAMEKLRLRMKPYLSSICESVLWRAKNKSSVMRMRAADLICKLIPTLHACGEASLLARLCTLLYESLGEEYPEVLGSILNAYRSALISIGVDQIEPPAKELLPRLSPILRNRHEKVQEACVDLVGRLAQHASEAVSAREWMRICFELLDNLKAPRKSIRKACIHTFGFIAKAIGPQDVLVTLLNNLKVQERTNRVSTTIAIAIVAETCGPFTVLPALLNEYSVPELNVQNGVLKSLAFLFEYIGEMSKDYAFSVVTLLEDALMDRDVVHRQIACSIIKHLSVNVAGLGSGLKEALGHLLNYVWPDCLETSPHMLQTFFDALEGLRLALGAGYLLQYVVQGLFHPARRIRDRFWSIYNQLYLGAQHSLVPYYPFGVGEGESVRSELLMFI